MKPKEKSLIKDNIVKHCIDHSKGGCSIRSISESINIEYSIVHTLIQELISQGIINKVGDTASRVDHTDDEMLVIINPRGRYFLNHEGGSSEQFKKHRRSKIWSITKIIAAALNAIAIIGISIWGISTKQDNKKLKNSILENEKIIIELDRRIDSLEKNSFLTIQDSIINKYYVQ